MKRPVFKQTDPPSENVSVEYSTENRSYDKKGNSIQDGPEWYDNANKVDFNSLSDKQKAAINSFGEGRGNLEDRVYSSNGNLYFDQGTFFGDEQQQNEPLLVQSNFNGNNTSNNEPTIDAESVDDSLNDFGARTFRVDGLKNDHTFSPNNPYIKDIKGEIITDRTILTPARKWERLNNSTRKRSANNRWGNNG